ncbi:MAG: hypothetical protein K2K21_11800 [Lachnospiraceae bacterium]|nr:hypothetical protein [Lachnospiraceae bacterium]
MKEYIMKSRIKFEKKVTKFFLKLTLAVFFSLVCCGTMGMTAFADKSDFKIDAEMMPSGIYTYDVRLTVENTGKDWEGTVRVTVDSSYSAYYNDCAYDTVISLPQGSTKQFVIRIPIPRDGTNSMSRTGDGVKVTLIDGNSNVAAERIFKQLLNSGVDALTMGILSDDYSSLTYMDMGGQKLYYYSDDYPIRLVELNQDNLPDSLDSLTFLVIDRYNTGVLTDDEISAIEDWTDDGGILVIGTGSYAEDTLSGLDYLGIECREVYEKGVNVNKWNSVSDYVDWSQLNMANIVDTSGRYYTYSQSLAMTRDKIDGAVAVLPYSLSELGALSASDYSDYVTQSDFVYVILDDSSSNANSRYGNSYSSGYDSSYMTRRMLSALGNSNNILNFGVLKFIVIVYVILVGPVFYLILRALKKRDLYWAVVPAAALVGIVLVFFAGRGFEVVSTRVYSVTVCNLSDRKDCRTYLHCFDAGHREWSLRLAEGYEYAGPQTSYGVSDDDEYYYRIRKEGDRLFFGIRPTTSFEDGYFCAGRTADARTEGGRIESDLSSMKFTVLSVTNDTNYDFDYFAVVEGDSVRVFRNLAAGETSSLNKKEEVFVSALGGYYYYDYMYDAREAVKAEEMDIMAALGIGISSAYSQLNGNGIAIIGLTTDWDKTVDDGCSEVSYGCLYMIQSQ